MPARRAAELMLVFLCFSLGAPKARAQIARRPDDSANRRGVDVTTHKFRPAVSPDLIILDASGMPLQGDAAIGPVAAQQIAALLRDKETRTAPQKKISSQLIYTTRMLQGLPAAPDVPSLETGVDVDGDGRVLVDISADVTDNLLFHLNEQRAAVYRSYPTMRSVR